MTSEKQIAANRRNALLSTGPTTGHGKKLSSMNAIRHGLTAQINVMTPEERDAYDQFCATLTEGLAPETILERHLAHSVAEDTWRLHRARSIENNIFALAAANMEDGMDTDDPIAGALAAARVFIADPHRFQLLTIYEQRIHRNMQKSLQQLTALQTTRHALEAKQQAERAQAFEEAAILSQLAEMEGESCDTATAAPNPNGFVFSNAEISQHVRYQRRLHDARTRFSSGNNLPGHSRPAPRTRAA